MKIVGIDDNPENTTEKQTAFLTEPPLTEEENTKTNKEKRSQDRLKAISEETGRPLGKPPSS